MESELKKLAHELGLKDRAHFAGNTPNPERFMEIMDVFALTSRSEGMPLVVLEAWASGLPVVASRVGGLPEMIDEGRTGILFEAGDDAALASRLEELLEDRELAQHLADEGRANVRKHFDASVMAANYQRHYMELLGRAEESLAVSVEAPACRD